ncbi:hypothetical protein [Paenibacillus mucilaginosus]|uniref:Uncharacterized protein n=3 Tax=Paenibacillus mucilaginosus TaxID=61624 RepID=H6NAL4_9BACL|nr:hypothetical protein [Paenibacillus mucilaginosus]AFC29939.1 hypothetical protein PM3016_3073 [Paenibacillus mucilaginosus 3016]AFH62126.1 hypothetical protein B2K_15580 [Paenibacillus mucilaginosus K02]MCG7211189.1 hypothetical protein [Paenibacillus mucilaginosus]WDM30415.1 hypothetical protein KCX80_15245 [Paenibacillus mucilaginosus]WFA18599.1 hypothetical protein ERY13_15600 [Paenibacillus mucilaginosus]
MKLRLLPVILSVLVSSSLLFGGYFAYQSFAMENPLQKTVSGIKGVELVAMDLSGTSAAMEIKLEKGTSLREVYHQIQSQGGTALARKDLKLKVTNPGSARLEQWWSTALFDIAQAMETKQYAQIPATLKEKAAQADQTGGAITATTEMDENYVYITLTDGEASKYIMLPRAAAKMGVWPNE